MTTIEKPITLKSSLKPEQLPGLNLTNLRKGSIVFRKQGDAESAYRVLSVLKTNKGIYITAESLRDSDVENEHFHGTPLPRYTMHESEIFSYCN